MSFFNVDRNKRLAQELGETTIGQTRGALYRTEDYNELPAGMCCVGVAIDLAIREGWISGHWDTDGDRAIYVSPRSSEEVIAPQEVRDAYGWLYPQGMSFTEESVRAVVPDAKIEDPAYLQMTVLNDGLRFDFQQIKQVMERQIALVEAELAAEGETS